MNTIEITPTVKPIVGYGSKILDEVCLPAEHTQKNLQLIADLEATLRTIKSGVGLAAPQINSPVRAFIMRQGNNYIPVINAVILKERTTGRIEEGCLSIPDVSAVGPWRSLILNIQYYDRAWNLVKTKISGFQAIIFQHELDHLNGILWIDRLKPEKIEELSDRLERIKKEMPPTNKEKTYHLIYP